MVIADDQRRYVGVSRAMCLLLRSDREAVLQMRVDDLTPSESRGAMERNWEAFMREGVGSGTFELLMPDGPRTLVEYSATANVEPGRHLSIFGLPVTEADAVTTPAEGRQLSVREREILTMVAMGESGATIADVLGISPATVESHVRNALAKAKNRAHAIALGLWRGEITIDLGRGAP